jgi:hypothetical protein
MNSVTNILSTYRSGLRTGQRRIEISEVITYLGRVAPWSYSQPTEVEVPAPKPAKTYFQRKLDQASTITESKFWGALIAMERSPPMLPPGSYTVESEMARLGMPSIHCSHRF